MESVQEAKSLLCLFGDISAVSLHSLRRSQYLRRKTIKYLQQAQSQGFMGRLDSYVKGRLCLGENGSVCVSLV